MSRLPSPFRPGRVTLATLIVLALPLPGGCGSKISDANYYRVQYGMTEDAVHDLLGPPHDETIEPVPETRPAGDDATQPAPATAPVTRKLKSWTRGGITLRVRFENGRVIDRTAEGIPFEGASRSAITTASTTPASL